MVSWESCLQSLFLSRLHPHFRSSKLSVHVSAIIRAPGLISTNTRSHQSAKPFALFWCHVYLHHLKLTSGCSILICIQPANKVDTLVSAAWILGHQTGSSVRMGSGVRQPKQEILHQVSTWMNKSLIAFKKFIHAENIMKNPISVCFRQSSCSCLKSQGRCINVNGSHGECLVYLPKEV